MNRVKEFNKTFGVVQSIEQRVKLLIEELEEYWEGVQLVVHAKEKSNVFRATQKGYREILDGLIDSRYILYGIMLEDSCKPFDDARMTNASCLNNDLYVDNRKVYDSIFDKIIEKDWYFIDACISELLASHGMLYRSEMAFQEVHNSNMSKACLTKEEAERVVSDYSTRGELCYHKKIGDKFIVYNKENKVRKGEHFYEPDLKSILYPCSCVSEAMKKVCSQCPNGEKYTMYV